MSVSRCCSLLPFSLLAFLGRFFFLVMQSLTLFNYSFFMCCSFVARICLKLHFKWIFFHPAPVCECESMIFLLKKTPLFSCDSKWINSLIHGRSASCSPHNILQLLIYFPNQKRTTSLFCIVIHQIRKRCLWSKRNSINVHTYKLSLSSSCVTIAPLYRLTLTSISSCSRHLMQINLT